MLVNYQLSNPWLQGEYEGWCSDWNEGSGQGKGLNHSYWVNGSQQECWAHCDVDDACHQAVYQRGTQGVAQCWTGLNRMPANKPPSGQPAATLCYAKGRYVEPIELKEEKFIAANDVVIPAPCCDSCAPS